MNREIETKTERLIELLGREKLGGVLLNAQHNFAWITAGSSNGIDLSRENGAASIFVRRDGRKFVLANNIELPRILSEEVSADGFEPVELSWQDEKASSESLVKKARSLSDGTIATDIAINDDTCAIEGKIAPCRYELTTDEVVRLYSLGTDTGRAIRETIDKISQYKSEIEIAATLRTELAVLNIASVVTLVAADERIVKYRHPIPTVNRWQKMLLLVTCAKRRGLIVGLSRIVCLGEVSNELKEKTEAAAFVNASLWNATRPGVTGSELYHTAVRAYAEAGFPNEINRHHQGGASGYKTREWVAHPRSTEVVRLNQAFAWNPSIAGTKVEETILVTNSRYETITTSPDFPVITNVIDGRDHLSPGILTL